MSTPKKAVFTLNVDGYAPEICRLTYPLFKRYAHKIGAEFIVIDDRVFPDFPPVYEKMQLFALAEFFDWVIFFDSDAVVHPDLFDLTEVVPRDTVMGYKQDVASSRFQYDDYFRRDGRHVGHGNWFAVASRWCRDLWRPLLQEMTAEEATARIRVSREEAASGIQPSHLIDDFVTSRNIARYGLKYKTFLSLQEELGCQQDHYFWHWYLATSITEKVEAMTRLMRSWQLLPAEVVNNENKDHDNGVLDADDLVGIQ